VVGQVVGIIGQHIVGYMTHVVWVWNINT
jgi:hypothetical protein